MGAGVLLTTDSATRILLFRDRKSHRYSDAGGALDHNETLEQCAARELFEESCGVIDLDVARSSRVRVNLSSGYTAFVVNVNAAEVERISRDYVTNSARMASDPCVPECMKETDDLRLFSVDDVLRAGVLSSSSGAKTGRVQDVTGVQCLLSKRIVCVLKKACAMRVLRFTPNPPGLQTMNNQVECPRSFLEL